jgi:tripartite-type tricarboxylate transporter receptor subunit TctC
MLRLAVPAVLATLLAAAAARGEEIADFYRGRQIDLIIGATVGGGYDAYARLLARHLSGHMPGHPAIVPRNMPGASSNKATSYIYEVAPRDGTAVGATNSGAILEPLLGDKLSGVDSVRMIYVGSANRETFLCYVRADSPVKSFADLFSHEIILAATAEGGPTRDFPTLLINMLGVKLRIISGYPGTREINMAVEQGEADGQCGYGWSSLIQAQPQWLAEHKITILAQEALTGHPRMNEMGVPLALSFAKTDEQRAVMELFYGQLVFGRPYILPPGTPPERVAALRQAFMETMRDPDLLADAAKTRLDVNPVAGEEVQAVVAKMFALPPHVVERTKQALVYKPAK